MKFEHIGMIGCGEVGKIFTAGLKEAVWQDYADKLLAARML